MTTKKGQPQHPENGKRTGDAGLRKYQNYGNTCTRYPAARSEAKTPLAKVQTRDGTHEIECPYRVCICDGRQQSGYNKMEERFELVF